MCFTLGAVLVKGGKIISSGYNHHRPHYDGAEVRTRGYRKPVSMHTEMHAIFSLTGMSPSFRKQQQGARTGASPQVQTPSPVARAPLPTLTPPPASRPKVFKGPAPLATCEGQPGPQRLQRAVVPVGFDTPSIHPQTLRLPTSPPLLPCRWRRGRRSRERTEPTQAGPADQWGRHLRRASDKDRRGQGATVWRCVEWCRWADVKRIFHWNGEDCKFEVVKVNTAERNQYETHGDVRLFAGT